MNVIITGANGGLGSALMTACAELYPDWRAVGILRNDADLTRPLDVVSPIVSKNPDVVIHCAAMTQVDRCETEQDLAWAVNVEGTRAVASAADTAGARLVFISTDYVFDGKGGAPYHVDSPPAPVNSYGRTKLEGERIALAGRESLVVRTSWLYGKVGKSFPATVLRLAQTNKELRMVNDQYGTPTYSKDLAEALLVLVEKKASGIYHVSNSGSATWYDLAKATLEITGVKGVEMIPISTQEFGGQTQRPADSRLDCGRYWDLTGKPVRHWHDALTEYLADGTPVPK